MTTVSPKRALAAVAGTGLAVAGSLLGRKRFSRSSASAPPSAPATPHVPGPSNVDAAGPPANTATPVAVPEPVAVPVLIDEAHEEAAAAAEAAAIGGAAPQYEGIDRDHPADEAMRAVLEGGGGEAEGFEQAEALLEENATLPADTPGAEPAALQLDEIIEAQDQRALGELDEALQAAEAGEADAVQHEER